MAPARAADELPAERMCEMIRLVLLTGFLGSGKTTMMKALIENYGSSRMGIIVNEFGEVNIDGKILRREGIEMYQVSNGSIFCACVKDKFVDSLIEMSYNDLDYLFIEASGLADPANMKRILEGIDDKLINGYDYRGSICILDAGSFLELYELLPAITSQLEFSSAVIINKADLIDEVILKEILETVAHVNDSAKVYVTSYCRVDIRQLVAEMSVNTAECRDSVNRPETRPTSFVLKGAKKIPFDKLRPFIGQLADYAYRIKGFADTDDGVKEISAVGKNVEISEWNESYEETEIVVISSVGFRMMSIITKAIEDYMKGYIRI